MLTSSRPEGDEPLTPARLLVGAGTVLRDSGQDAVVAAGVLVLVAFGIIGRLTTGPAMAAPRVTVLAVLAVSFLISGTLALRTRLTLLRTLGEMRVRVGAPIDPRVPWTPAGSYAAVREDVLRRELQRLVGAAYRCHDLSLHALMWAMVTALLFLVWLVV